MNFTETRLTGAFVIQPDVYADERGVLATTFLIEEFEKRGLCTQYVRSIASTSRKAGTLRGMHFQLAPHAEVKLVRCPRGRVYDVIIDLRPDSPTFKQHVGVELSATNHSMLYIPKGFAHGFVTLEDDCEVNYQVSAPYVPPAAKGVRWNDPVFAIQWPREVTVVNQRDNTYPDFVG